MVVVGKSLSPCLDKCAPQTTRNIPLYPPELVTKLNTGLLAHKLSRCALCAQGWSCRGVEQVGSYVQTNGRPYTWISRHLCRNNADKTSHRAHVILIAQDRKPTPHWWSASHHRLGNRCWVPQDPDRRSSNYCCRVARSDVHPPNVLIPLRLMDR